MATASAQEWNERYSAEEYVWSVEPNQFVVSHLSDLTPGKMLDLGGGEGRNALWFASRGWSVENSDFSEVAIAKSVALADEAGVSSRFTGTVADSTSSSACVTGPVDLVVVSYLQLPENELTSAIASASEALVDGGTFFGVWHAQENLRHGYGGPRDPAVLPTVPQLTAAAEAAGLTVQQASWKHRMVPTGSGDKVAIDVVLLATK